MTLQYEVRVSDQDLYMYDLLGCPLGLLFSCPFIFKSLTQSAVEKCSIWDCQQSYLPLFLKFKPRLD